MTHDSRLTTQLQMRRPHLDDLAPLPELSKGYALRLLRADEAAILAVVLQGSFPEMEWTAEKARGALIDAPDVDTTYAVTYEDVPVAVASSRYRPERFPDSGYLHWVGCDPAHQGKRLGAIVSLRVLYHFRDLGRRDSLLHTDDFRLPAIKTYLNLGYVPEPVADDHPARWAEVQARLVNGGSSDSHAG